MTTHDVDALDILDGLNPAQRDAVLHGEGPLLIVAGAGTGKTTVLTRRIAQLIRSKAALPSEILALTFTDKAAGEMEDRVDRLVPYGFNDVWISTFHSFGDRILRENAFEIGLSPDLKVLTQPEAVVFLRQNLFQFELDVYRPLSDPTRFLNALLSAFSRAKDEDVLPPEYLKGAQTLEAQAKTQEEGEFAKKCLEAAKAYALYENLKTQKGFIDFGDQVLLALKIFREHPSVLETYRKRFKYILVDEFQDTNYAQFELLKLLSNDLRNITVVGDDDQSIYKFRGACLSNILGFRKAYPDARQIVLQDNYRSNQEILDYAYKLIQHNNPDRLEYRDGLSKFLRSSKGYGGRVEYLHFDTLFSESGWVAAEIQKRIESKTHEPRDFAVLVRSNNAADPFLKSLAALGIPWRFSGTAGLYDQEEVRVALAFLRALDQPDDSASLYYLAVSFLYGIGAEDCSALTQIAHRARRPLFDVLKLYIEKGDAGLTEENLVRVEEGRPAAVLSVSEESRQKMKKLVDDLARYRKDAAKTPTGNLLYKFLEESGFLRRLAEAADWQAAQQAQNLHQFFNMIKRFSQVSEYDRVHYFVQHVDGLRSAGEDPASAQAGADDNAVNVLTVHAAKGLEFPVVFLVGLEQNNFPLTSRRDPIELPEILIKDILPSGNAHVQEERRLFYVGMTRAKDELIFCGARDLGKKKMWKPSQFVLETLDKPGVGETTIKSNPLDELKAFAGPAAPQNPALFPETPADSPVSLQVTGIDDYLTCPLKYKFSKVLRIPVLMHHSAVFGVAVHEALKGYHLARREKRDMKLQDFLDLFKRAWVSEGFVSREHEEKRFQEGIKVLKAYYKSEQASDRLPGLVEEDFKIVLEDARIRGRFDRVDMDMADNVVIDYKTGDVKDQKDADSKARESLQLSFYAYAFKERFGKLPDRTVLSFLRYNLTGTAIPTEDKVAKTLETTRTVIQNIRAQKFDPTPGFHCKWCAYEKICPAAADRSGTI